MAKTFEEWDETRKLLPTSQQLKMQGIDWMRHAWEGRQPEIDALTAERDRLRKALEVVEWVQPEGESRYCPWCKAAYEHEDDCQRQLALKSATEGR